MPIEKKHKPFSELVKQIEAYGLKDKLADLARKEEVRRPFHHLPKQFSKGILIGNIAIVPKKSTGTRYVYVIADMLEAKLLYEDINLKQTAILVAHHLADGKSEPSQLIEYDTHFASHVFEITNCKRMLKQAQKDEDDAQEEIYTQKLEDAHRLADEYKGRIQDIFQSTFSA
jgi:hypothetical protein|tara:strand:- start:430 stop:945 length:516 start_codon:yes stop_codon:yes gene_type:complete